MRKVSIIAALLLVMPAISQANTLEELLVEKGVITKSEARASMGGGASKVYWNKGTRLEFPDNGFTAKIGTQLQTRYMFTDNDDGVDNTSSFSIRRARIMVSGTALHNEFEYKIQAEFAGSPDLRDAYLKWNACEDGSLKMGQFKTGVSRQYNTSSTMLQFADRSDASNLFDLGRQSGLQIATGLGDMVDVSAAIFNGRSDGEGRNRPGVDTNHTVVVGARADLMGEMNAHEEGDIGWTEDAALNVGVAYAFSDASNDVGAGLEETDLHSLSVDANYKYQGMSVHAEFFWADFESDTSSAESEPIGFYIQGGYFLTPKEVELAVRYGFADCDDGSGGLLGSGDTCDGTDDANQVSVSLNYYWWKHHLKAQLGYEFINQDGLGAAAPGVDNDTNTNKWLLQLSSWF